jgi:uncharacterized protein (TIGR02597 family)
MTLLGLLWMAIGWAVDPVTETVGFYRLTCLSNSDTRIAIPFTRPAAYVGLVQGVTNNVLTVLGNPGWSNGQFIYQVGVQSNTYYTFFASGAKDGIYLSVTNNTTNSLLLELDVTDLSGVAVSNQIRVIPYWTLGTAFRPGKEVHISSSASIRRTEILTFNPEYVGIEQSSQASYFYISQTTNIGWRKIGTNVSLSFADQILLPDMNFLVRHRTQTNTIYGPLGSVIPGNLTIPLYTETNDQQDTIIAMQRPTLYSLNESGLIASGAFDASLSPSNRTEILMFFDNTAVGLNKRPYITNYYYNGAWRQVNLSESADAGTNQNFIPGAGFILRKNTNATGDLIFWTNSPNYTP